MEKRKYQEEMSNEELLKAVEDVESKMADEMSDRELLRAVKRIESPLFELEFQTMGLRKRCKTKVYNTLERITPTLTR